MIFNYKIYLITAELYEYKMIDVFLDIKNVYICTYITLKYIFYYDN